MILLSADDTIDDSIASEKTPSQVFCTQCGKKAWAGVNIVEGVHMLHVHCITSANAGDDSGCGHVESGLRGWQTAPAVSRSDDPLDIHYANFDEMMDRVRHYLGPETTLRDFEFLRTVRGDYMWRTAQAAKIYGAWR